MLTLTSAVNSVTPQIVLHLGFESSSWIISIRQLAYSITSLVASIPITLYATKFKDLKYPLLATFGLFLVVVVCYGCITPTWNHAQIRFRLLQSPLAFPWMLTYIPNCSLGGIVPSKAWTGSSGTDGCHVDHDTALGPLDADPERVAHAIRTAFVNLDQELTSAPLRILAEHVDKLGIQKGAIPDLSQHPMALASMLPAMSGM